MFFVGASMQEGKINIFIKGLDSLRVLYENRVVWLNLAKSGTEIAAHFLNQNRMTLMFCAFKGPPLILRFYGTANIYITNMMFFGRNIFHSLKTFQAGGN